MSSTHVYMKSLPKCQFCELPARYDFRTFKGMWAYACEAHYTTLRMHDKLGTGRGQRLLLEGEQEQGNERA